MAAIIQPGTKEWRDQAENDLIDLVRGNDAQSFRIVITRFAGRYSVETIDNMLPDPRFTCTGSGLTFADAWHGQEPAWAKEEQG